MFMADEVDPTDTGRLRVLRRTVLRTLGMVSAVAAVPAGAIAQGDAGGTGSRIRRRVQTEFETRVAMARRQLVREVDTTPHESNGRLSADAVVSKFGKGLEHDHDTGLLTVEAYESLVRACESGEGFDGVRLSSLEAYDIDASPAPDTIHPEPVIDDERNLGARPLVQPESAWSYLAEGGSPAQFGIAKPPAFDSPQTGAEMVELYWRALTQDVPFHEHEGDTLVREAAWELDDIDDYRGPGSDADPLSDSLHEGNVFRGITPGCQTGPYVSQFLWKDRKLGGKTEDQKIKSQAATTTPTGYLTTVGDWLKAQNGVAPGTDKNLPGNELADTFRHIVTGRDLCERVHSDPPFRQLQKTAQVLIFTMRAPLDENIPYTLKPFQKKNLFGDVVDGSFKTERNEESRRDADSFFSQTRLPFNDFGPLFIEKKVIEASEHGQKAAWHKKWNVHRRLRPEEYGGRVQAVKRGTDATGRDLSAAEAYPVPDNLLDSEALEKSGNGSVRFGSYLLPQAYAEGLPTHPSYPAGHSVVAGAGVTVLKTLFDGDYVFPADEKVVPTEDGTTLVHADEVPDGNPIANAHDLFEELTVRGELNKFASNMALGRNRAGIHYRSDGIEGLRLGEAVAIRFLEGQLSLPGTGDVALSFESFDGELVTVEPTV